MRVTTRSLAALLFVLALSLSPRADASDPIGVYGIIDKVVLEPETGPAERIQVWGAFALAKNEPRNAYRDAARGCLYFTLPAEKADEVRREWEDLRKVAGTGECVGFGFRHSKSFTLRRGVEKTSKTGEAAKPDLYPMGWGVHRLPADRDYGPVRQVMSLPAPKSPADGGSAAPGCVELLAVNASLKLAAGGKYYFEIQTRGGEKERSPAINPGEKETRWKPALELKAGETYTWRVWLKDGDWTGPTASAEFSVKAPAEAKA
jgi:hypothetical protein